MCVFFRFRVVVGVYPYIISSIYRRVSIAGRPIVAWKEGERARPAQLKAVDQRIRAGTDAIRHLSNDAGRFPHQSAQVSPPARLEPSDSSGRSRKRAEGKKKRKARNSMVSGARKELHTSLLMMSFWKLFSLSTERHADLTLTNDRFLFSLLPLMSRLLCVTPSLMAITAAG